MKKVIAKTKYLILLFVLLLSFNTHAAKYTITNGQDFNTKVRDYLSNNNLGSIEDIKEFKYSTENKDKALDISEDSDKSVFAYLEDGCLYYYADDNISLNEDLSKMFEGFTNIETIDLSDCDYDKIRKADYMFKDCIYLNRLDMDNNSIINIYELEGMFFNCQSLISLYIDMLNTKNVTNFKNMFYNCKNLRYIYININQWSIVKGTDFQNMYTNCTSLRTNQNNPAVDITENNYKVYSRAGNSKLEGLLRNIDYEYEDLPSELEDVNSNEKFDSAISQSSNTNNLLHLGMIIAIIIILIGAGIIITMRKNDNNNFDISI